MILNVINNTSKCCMKIYCEIIISVKEISHFLTLIFKIQFFKYYQQNSPFSLQNYISFLKSFKNISYKFCKVLNLKKSELSPLHFLITGMGHRKSQLLFFFLFVSLLEKNLCIHLYQGTVKRYIAQRFFLVNCGTTEYKNSRQFGP